MSRARRIAIGGVLTLSVAAIAGLHGRAQAQDSYNFETKKGHITVVGCLQRQTFGTHEKYVVVNPSLGPGESVTQASCESAGNVATFQIEDEKRAGIDDSMVNQWVQITGRLGGIQDSNGLRRLHARQSNLVPVIVPQAKASPSVEPPVTYQPSPTYQPPSVASESPAQIPEARGTSGVIQKKKLPATASQLPLIGLLGLIAIAAGFSLRQINTRQGANGAAE